MLQVRVMGEGEHKQVGRLYLCLFWRGPRTASAALDPGAKADHTDFGTNTLHTRLKREGLGAFILVWKKLL